MHDDYDLTVRPTCEKLVETPVNAVECLFEFLTMDGIDRMTVCRAVIVIREGAVRWS